MVDMVLNIGLPDSVFLMKKDGVVIWVGDWGFPAPLQEYDELVVSLMGYQMIQGQFVDNYPLQ